MRSKLLAETGAPQVLRTLLSGLAAAALCVAPAAGSQIYGTMSNFDVFNETPTDAYGAELELEDVHRTDVLRTFPSHFDSESIVEYAEGGRFGVRFQYSGYNFDPSGFLAPTVGQSTNGHACVNLAGCEHFGFGLQAQPTASRFYWLDQNLQRIGANPTAIPSPTWSVAPGGGLQAAVRVPEPAEVHVQQPDSIWMKVFKTEIERPARLNELMSDDDVVPHEESETEVEWELLEGGKMEQAEDDVGENAEAVIRRYEFYQYTGPYDEEHEPTSVFLDSDLREPPQGELGQFIAANMAAANLVPVLIGDATDDGVVDLSDFNVLKSHFGEQDEIFSHGDFDFSGAVDLRDFILLKQHFGEGAAAVPEPSTAFLVLLAAAPVLLVARRL